MDTQTDRDRDREIEGRVGGRTSWREGMREMGGVGKREMEKERRRVCMNSCICLWCFWLLFLVCLIVCSCCFFFFFFFFFFWGGGGGVEGVREKGRALVYLNIIT